MVYVLLVVFAKWGLKNEPIILGTEHFSSLEELYILGAQKWAPKILIGQVAKSVKSRGWKRLKK